jgi:hypothetical protein
MTGIIRILAEETGLREALIHKILVSAPIRYKTYSIPKRAGGERIISQPAREVKLLQRALMRTTLRPLPIHECAKAYRSGLSILDNAKPHAGDRKILKMDFKDFFPSIRKLDWVKYCAQTGCLVTHEDVELTSSLLFQRPKGSSILRLAIGAPSSPMLSNILMYEFDRRVTEALVTDKVVYTRYADDLTFSAPRTGFLNSVVKTVTSIARSLDYPRLTINRDKTTYVTTKYHRHVTGLTLANDGRITIGRDKKRQLHAAVHRASKSLLSLGELQALSGTLAFVNAVEPEFLDVLRRKYGTNIVSQIQQTVIIKTAHRSRSHNVRT